MYEGHIRVITWNIHAGIGADRRYNLPRIIDILRRHAPDIVALQEVDSRGRLEDLPLTALTKALGEHSAEARTIVAPDGHYGHVLISHWPMKEVRLHDISVPRHEARFAMTASMETPLGRIAVLAVHLGLRLGEGKWQVQRLREIIADLQGPILMVGDFNDWHGYVGRFIQPLLSQRSHGKTFPARWPLLNLDGIYARPPIRLIRSWVDRDGKLASDHLPVIADITLDGTGSAEVRDLHEMITIAAS